MCRTWWAETEKIAFPTSMWWDSIKTSDSPNGSIIVAASFIVQLRNGNFPSYDNHYFTQSKNYQQSCRRNGTAVGSWCPTPSNGLIEWHGRSRSPDEHTERLMTIPMCFVDFSESFNPTTAETMKVHKLLPSAALAGRTSATASWWKINENFSALLGRAQVKFKFHVRKPGVSLCNQFVADGNLDFPDVWLPYGHLPLLGRPLAIRIASSSVQ